MKKVLLLMILAFSVSLAFATKDTCAVYFTGIGCPHCAKTDPVVLEQVISENPNLVIIEYEIYQQSENAPLLYFYNDEYGSGLGVPLIIISKEKYIIGDMPIIKGIRDAVKEKNDCPLVDGTSAKFEDLDILLLPGRPKIWTKDRILIKIAETNISPKSLLLAENISKELEKFDYKAINPEPVPLSGRVVKFQNAVEINGWIFQWNGEGTKGEDGIVKSNKTKKGYSQPIMLTLPKIISLAVVDSINPCALAVLTLMLIAILTYNPKEKTKVLLAGMAFVTSVFIMYLLYGLVIVKSFQLIQTLTAIRLYLYKILGIAAIVLGTLNIKDFIKYRPGGVLTEMPLSLRPKVKKIISGITSPAGAFTVGLFVTFFLLPCTIGPYVIAGGILSTLEMIKTIPWLLLYNLVFILPMVGITLAIYIGFKKVEDVSEWKEKNIQKLHLVAGLIMFGLGISMLLGLI